MKQRVERLVAALRTPAGRLLMVSGGVGGVTFIVRHLGVAQVLGALAAGASRFPLVLGLELVVMACTLLALRSLYGEAAAALPWAQLARAGLIGYAVMGLVPAGRAVAEVARASMMARFVGTRRAANAAFQMQAVALLANAATSALATLAMWYALGPSLMTAAIAGNCAVTLALGSAILYIGRRPGVDGWVARHLAPPSERHHQPTELDLPALRRALLWEGLGRLAQLLQNGVLVWAVGGAFGVLPALASEAVHLVGVALGELMPAQLGFTEANFTLSAQAIGLPPARAVAIALLAHLAQLSWVLVGSLVPLLWPALAPPVATAQSPIAAGPDGAGGAAPPRAGEPGQGKSAPPLPAP